MLYLSVGEMPRKMFSEDIGERSSPGRYLCGLNSDGLLNN